MGNFLAQHAHLSVDIRLTDSMVDLVEGGFDVAIRNAQLKDSTLIAKKLATDQRIICVSPQYIAKHGKPETPDDLLNHQCINHAGLENWTFATKQGNVKIKTTGNIRVDNGEAVRDACVNGMGISMCATWIAYEQIKTGELVSILQDFPLLDDAAIWAVYPSSRLLAPKCAHLLTTFLNIMVHPPTGIKHLTLKWTYNY